MPYRIRTPRLSLSCCDPKHAALVRAAIDASDAHLRPWIPFMRDEPRSLEETAAWLCNRRAMFDNRENYVFSIFYAAGGDQSESPYLGESMLLGRAGEGALELGYWSDCRHAGHGYGTEASAALVRVAFEHLAVNRVELHCAPQNAASIRVAEKLGFGHEATLSNRFENDLGQLQDQMIWTLFRNQFSDTHSSSVQIQLHDAMERPLELANPVPR